MAEDQNKKKFLQGLLGTEDYDSTAIRGLLGIAAGALQPGVTSTGQALGAGLAGGLGQIDVARQQQAATALRAAQMDKLKAETKKLGLRPAQWSVIKNPYGMGGAGIRNPKTGEIKGYQGPPKAEKPDTKTATNWWIEDGSGGRAIISYDGGRTMQTEKGAMPMPLNAVRMGPESGLQASFDNQPPAAPPGPPTDSLVPQGQNASGSFGFSGTVTGLLNKASDFLGAKRFDEAVAQGGEAVRIINLQATSAFADTISGKPNRLVMELIKEVQAESGKIFTGDEEAKSKIGLLKGYADQEAYRIYREILTKPGAYPRTMLAKERIRYGQLLSISKQYGNVLKSFESGFKPKPKSARDADLKKRLERY